MRVITDETANFDIALGFGTSKFGELRDQMHHFQITLVLRRQHLLRRNPG